MAYSNGGSQRYPHQDEAPNTHVAHNQHHATGGDTLVDSMTGGDDGGAGGAGGGGGGGGEFAGGGVPGDPQFAENGPRVYGPGDDHDDHAPSGFMPNGEDGLMTLASYVMTHGGDGGQHENSGDNSDHVPGGFQGQGEQPSGGQGVGLGGGGSSLPGADGGQDGPPGAGPGGFSLGLGGGGGGFGGGMGMGGGLGGGLGGGSGGGGSFGGGSNPGGGSTLFPGGGDTPHSGGSTNTGSNDSGSGGGGSGGGGTVCVVSAIETCGGSPGPITQTQTLGPQPLVTGGGNDSVVGGVPEPAVWTMIILGFGGLGTALRARRRAALAA